VPLYPIVRVGVFGKVVLVVFRCVLTELVCGVGFHSFHLVLFGFFGGILGFCAFWASGCYSHGLVEIDVFGQLDLSCTPHDAAVHGEDEGKGGKHDVGCDRIDSHPPHTFLANRVHALPP